MNINTKDYWEKRYASGDWEAKEGRQQTIIQTKALIRHLKITSEFSGKLLDFGCGLGDSMPIYREFYKRASLIGVDISQTAIEKCNEMYSDIASFIQGDYTHVPDVDIIISCAVFEHLSEQMRVARHLLTKCSDLYIIAPYKEVLCPGNEHINSYNLSSFSEVGACDSTWFLSKSCSEYGKRLWIDVYLKNLLRPFFGKKIVYRRKMVIFHLKPEINLADNSK